MEQIIVRDPNDLKQIQIQRIWITVLILLLGSVLGLVSFLVLRVPDRVVVQYHPDGQVVILDNRHPGKSGQVSLEKDDGRTDEYRVFAATLFASFRHTMTPQNMDEQLGKSLDLMTSDAGRTMNATWEKTRFVEKRLAESFSSKWRLLQIFHEPGSKTVRIQGEETATRLIEGALHEQRQVYTLELVLVEDPKGPTQQNFMSGFLVAKLTETADSKQSTDLVIQPVSVGNPENVASQSENSTN